MGKKTHGKFVKSKQGNSALFYVPADIVKDSLFPFNVPEDQVNFRIDGDRIIVEKVKPEITTAIPAT